MAVATAALIASAVIAAASTGYQVKAGADARHDAADAASEQKGAQDKLINDAKEKASGDFAKQESDAVKEAARLKRSQASGVSSAVAPETPSTTVGAVSGMTPPPPGKTLLGM